MGPYPLRMSQPDRLLLPDAFAILPLTVSGTVGEELDVGRHLKLITGEARTRSLLHRGCAFDDLIPNRHGVRLLPPMKRFAEAVQRSCATHTKRRKC